VLFAQTGIAHTSTRAILRAAGQRNESALSYHFGGRDGLVAALHERRMAQVEQLRQERLAKLAPDGELGLRDILEIQVVPFVDRARADSGFVNYLCAIGEVVFSPRAELARVIDHYDIGSDATLRTQMQRVLASHDAAALLRRADLCRRFMIMSLSQWCREHGRLDDAASAQFITDLLDMMTAMLTAGETPPGR
jgi:AcrR family transcriptional regulator